MKKLVSFLSAALALTWVVASLTLSVLALGCAGTQKKVTEGLNQVSQAVTQVSETVDQAAAVVNTTANTVDNAANTVRDLEDSAKRLATRVEGLPHYDRHRVVRGDTLWGISRASYKTGFLWPLICKQNGLQDCDVIRVGEVVRVAPASMLSTYSADELDQYRQTAYRAR